jgi:hypothetical protein
LPQGISREAGEKLVDSWLSRLDDNPAFHDKVEFEIVPTVLTPDFEDIFQERYGDILSSVEFVEYRIRLMDLTKKAFNGGSLHSALSSVEKLRNLQENSLLSARYSAETMSPFDIALDLNEAMEHCRSMGTLPFAVIARHAFIAETWLRAAMRAGALSEDRVALLKRSIETISGTLTRDFNAVLAGRMHREIFLHNYGHLRPGMYDILSPSYRERTDLFDAQPNTGGHDSAPAFTFTSNEKNDVESLFSTCGLTLSAESFLRYVGTAVAGREYGKFIFSRHLDHILYLVKFFGCKFNFTPDELSMLTLDDILSLGFQPLPSAGKDYFSERIHAGRGEYDLGRCFKLSWLLRSPRDVYIVPQHRSQPNFIGTEIVDADIAVLTTDGATPEMEGKIVCIESADPGYDWIFTRHIAGLITRYGGTNSHMAIRCAEYGLPAAIGCGEQIFTMAIAAGRLHMDCASKTVRPVDRLWD